ncbi:MAG: VWA domain-containing protein [Pseudomonadota bacterium]
MLIPFFFNLRQARLPVSITEFLSFLRLLKSRVGDFTVDHFYYLARLSLVKDEAHFDRFDQLFSYYFQGAESLAEALFGEVPEEWLRRQAELNLTEEEKAQIEALGGWEKLMETLKKRLEEQDDRHQGGDKWIGTAGRSPFGAYGYNPEGVRIGQQGSRNRSAVKVWDKRIFKNLDGDTELGTRNLKVALRRLRQFARQGADEELDLDGTINGTAKNAGLLDIMMVPERRNAVKVLIFFDIGGSMDDHIRVCEQLFSAAKSEFKQLEYFYFHNCLYERVWRNNKRRHTEVIPTWDLMHRYGSDYKVVLVGDATMSPYEITYPGGSVEHWNEEPGAVWIKRLKQIYPKLIWLNPEPERVWDHTYSIRILKELVENEMYPLTVDGISRGMASLVS